MRASNVTPRAVDWLWHPYVPLGKISVVAGQMGQAKSLLTCWLAAYTAARGEGVIMMSAEDDPADTVRPRLEAAGADLDRVEIAELVELNADALSNLCDELGGVRLITIDPIQAFLSSSVNAWKGQDVRLALEPVRRLAAERAIAIVLIQHLNRRSDGDPLSRIADSQGIPQLARSVMVWGADPGDPDGDQGSMKALTRAKGNLARGSSDSATFRIVEHVVTEDIKAPALERGDDARIGAEDIVADRETRSARDEAVEWLGELLASGPIAAKDGQRQAHADGISERTLKRAKAALGVISESNRSDSTISGWTWRLPDPDTSHTYSSGPLDIVGTVGPLDKGANEAKKAKKATYNGTAPCSCVSGPGELADGRCSRCFGAPS